MSFTPKNANLMILPSVCFDLITQNSFFVKIVHFNFYQNLNSLFSKYYFADLRFSNHLFLSEMSLKALSDQIEFEILQAVQRGNKIEVTAKLEVFRMIREAWKVLDDIHQVIANYNRTVQPINSHLSALPFGLSTMTTTMKTNAFRSAIGL